MRQARAPELAGELDALLAARNVCPVFQPIVDLGTGEPVAFEALARGPAGSPLAMPDLLFAAARGAGRVHELDRLCQLRSGCSSTSNPPQSAALSRPWRCSTDCGSGGSLW